MIAPAAPVRITFRLHRFELVAFVLLAGVAIAGAFLVAARLDAVGYGRHCVDASMTGAPTPIDCEFKVNQFYEIVYQAGIVSVFLTGIPFLAALILGVAVVGREIERGTTRLAWALTPSRMRWFAHRLIPVIAIVALGTFLLGFAADRLLAATEPGIDPANAFAQFGLRGVVLAARSVFVFGLAVLVGALMGRALPALIVAGIVAGIGIAGGTQVHAEILKSEAIPIEEPDMQAGDLYIDQRVRLPDGRLIGGDEVEQYDPPPTDPDFAGEWPTLPTVAIAVPGSRYREVEIREVAALVGGTLVALLATLVIVQRRRPG